MPQMSKGDCHLALDSADTYTTARTQKLHKYLPLVVHKRPCLLITSSQHESTAKLITTNLSAVSDSRESPSLVRWPEEALACNPVSQGEVPSDRQALFAVES